MDANKGKEGTFTIIDENGKEITYDILFTFDSEETKKSYVVFTDNSVDESGSIATYASVYDPTGENKELMPIETDAEWDLIENLLAQIEDKVSSEADNN